MTTSSQLSLSNRTVLVTRPSDQAEGLKRKLESLGAQTVVLPTVLIAPAEDYSDLDRAITQLDSYDWFIFASGNGVRFFHQRLKLIRPYGPLPASVKIGAIGPATSQALRGLGFPVHFAPSKFLSEAIVEEIGDIHGQLILLPRADIASSELPEGLRKKGAVVHQVVAYRTLPSIHSQEFVQKLLDSRIDAITFTSASTVSNFVRLLGRSRAGQLAETASVICIGPVTARAATEHGLKITSIAHEHSEDGLVKAVMEALSK